MGLDTLRERGGFRSAGRGGHSVDVDRVGFEMLGDPAAWRAFGDLAAAFEHRQAFGSLSASDNPSTACWPL